METVNLGMAFQYLDAGEGIRRGTSVPGFEHPPLLEQVSSNSRNVDRTLPTRA